MKREREILKGRCEGNRQQRNHKIPLSNGNKNEGKPFVCSYSNLDLISWLRQLALDPCEMEASIGENQKNCNHILKMRKFALMDAKKTPQRKRKFENFLSETMYQQIGSKSTKGQFSAPPLQSSCIVDWNNTDESFNRQVVDNFHSSGSLVTVEDTVQWNQANFVEQATKYSFPLVDSDESANGLIPEKLIHKRHPLLDADDSGQSSYSPGLAEPNSSKFPRLAIPIGPRFQAEVPTCVNNKNIGQYKVSSDNLRWLGTRVWPVESENMDASFEKVGKGRPDACSCKSPGSLDCTKHHILEKRVDLQAKIGDAFLTWKFDDMGEEVSKSWTLKEQRTFSNLRRKYMDDEGMFWAQALKYLPYKCKKSILSYHFNVFIPKRLSVETKLSSKQIYSDDEEVEDEEEDNDDNGDNDKKGSRRKSKSKSKRDASRKPKDVKKQYMRHVH